MRKYIIAALALCIALPAYAAAERKQETVELGNNRFLIFAGEPNNAQFAYTADLIVLKSGVPHMDPLFMEEYDVDTNSVNISEGIAFLAANYHFDKKTSMLDFTTTDPDRHARFQYKYLLNVDMLTLQEVVMQKDDEQTALPKIIYKAKK